MLPLLAPILFTILIHQIFRCLGTGRRAALLHTAMTLGVFIAASTELLSLFHLLTFPALLTTWLLADAAAITIHIFTPRHPASSIKQTPPLSVSERAIFCLIILILATTFFSGISSAPTNWDSMTYHLPRVMHWMQNRSVAHYPTTCLPQLYQPPLAEFAILHLQLLTGSDRWAFSIQWLAFALCLAGTSLIATQFTTDRRPQLFASAIVASTPVAILQAQSTQNSLVLAAWLVCGSYFLLTISRHPPGQRTWTILAFGTSLGLAIFTKGTAYALGLPLVLGFAIVLIRKISPRDMLATTAAIVIALSLNAGHFSRNLRAFDNPLVAPSEFIIYRPQQMSPALFLSNIVRNLALNLASPSISLNQWMHGRIDALHSAIGLSTSDPRITSPGQRFDLHWHVINEDLTGNPLHLLLIAAAMYLLIRNVRRPGSGGGMGEPGGLFITAGILIASAAFCTTLKWQLFNVRLQLPLFVLAAIPAAIALAQIRRQILPAGIVLAMLLLSLPFVFLNPGHPLFGRHSIFLHPRQEQYFANRTTLYQPYQQMTDFLAAHDCSTIALAGGGDGWEYPLWIMMHSKLNRWPRITAATEALHHADAIVLLDSPMQSQLPADVLLQWPVHHFADMIVFIPPTVPPDPDPAAAPNAPPANSHPPVLSR